MTDPLNYLLGDNPTNTHYCLLCAQEECADASGLHKVAGWMGKRLLDCPRCDGTGSKLVPIAEHPVDHEHVRATVNLFKYMRLNDWSVEQALDFLMRNTGLAYAAQSKADLWDMADAVGGCVRQPNGKWTCLGGAKGYGTFGFNDYDTRDEAVKWAFIAQGYETQKERVKG